MWIPLWPHDDDHDDDDSNFLVSFFFHSRTDFCNLWEWISLWILWFVLYPLLLPPFSMRQSDRSFLPQSRLISACISSCYSASFFSYFSSLSYFICCCFRYFLRYQWSQFGSRTLRRKILCYCNTWLSCNILLSIITLGISLLNFILLKFLILNIFRLTKLMSLLHTKIKISERKRRSLCKVK